MAWPQFMCTPIPSSTSSDRGLKPSIYFAGGENVVGNAYEGDSGSRGSGDEGPGLKEVTLEDYLTKGRVARGGGDGEEEGGGGERGGRGRKRAAADTVDRAALQRQKRMIKNRESAARSRERKQQYTNQLEQTVFKLEEENAMLLKEREELLKWRFTQIVENVIPVDEQKKSVRALRRSNSFP